MNRFRRPLLVFCIIAGFIASVIWLVNAIIYPERWEMFLIASVAAAVGAVKSWRAYDNYDEDDDDE